jgi:hypothetical protein
MTCARCNGTVPDPSCWVCCDDDEEEPDWFAAAKDWEESQEED